MQKIETEQTRSGIVAIIGPPNAGKSTLLNAILGQKLAIVSPKPQTTRNRISGILTMNQAQIVFLDTPGVHQSKQPMNRHLVQSAWQALSGADQVLIVLDALLYIRNQRKLKADLMHLQSSELLFTMQMAIVLNKIDLVQDKQSLLPLMQSLHQAWPEATIFPVSADQGQGVSKLLEHVTQFLPFGPLLYPEEQLSTLPMRFLASEIIREKLFLALEQELPYSLAVQIENWQEDRKTGLIWVQGLIFVSRAGHKPMIIGKNGAMLKKVGQAARLELETVLDQRLHLELWVKVKPKWNRNQRFLQELIPQT